MSAKRLNLRLLLEGVEVPVISAAIQINANQPAMASIQMVPTSSGTDLKPRTLVQLFTLDPTESSKALKRYVQTRYDHAPEYGLDDYKLVFDGELIGYQYLKTESSRSLMLQCADHSQNWDMCYQYFYNYQDSLGDTSQHFSGASTRHFSPVMQQVGLTSSELLVNGAVNGPRRKDLQHYRGMMGGMLRILEALGGIGSEHTRGVNDFFTGQEARLRLLSQIGAATRDDSHKLMQDVQLWRLLGNTLEQMGEMSTVRHVINTVMAAIFYQTFPNPAPYYVPAGETASTRTRRRIGELSQDPFMPVKHKRGEKVLSDSLFRRDKKTSKVVVRKGATISKGTRIDKESGKVRDHGGVDLYADPGTPVRAAFDGKVTFASTKAHVSAGWYVDLEHRTVSTSVPGEYVQTRYLHLTANELKVKKGQVVRAGQILGTIGPNDGSTGVSTSNPHCHFEINAISKTKDKKTVRTLNPLLEFGHLLDEAHLRALRASLVSVNKKTKEVIDRFRTRVTKLRDVGGERLITQVFRPDIFFVPPPTCNVLFPDQYNYLTFQRNFLQESTRMELRAGMYIGANNNFFDQRYHAPQLKLSKGKKDLHGDPHAIRELMDHERFTGIIPDFRQINEVLFFRQKSDIVRRVEGRFEKVEFLSLVASFHFFKARFLTRTMGASCMYSPQLVAGVPGLVIERPDLDSPILLAKNEATDLLGGHEQVRAGGPHHYLGMVEGLTHSINQHGGTTQVSFSHSRFHDSTDDEYFGHDKVTGDLFHLARGDAAPEVTEVSWKPGKMEEADIKFLLAAVDHKNIVLSGFLGIDLLLGAKGPKGGEIVEIEIQDVDHGPDHPTDPGKEEGGARLHTAPIPMDRVNGVAIDLDKNKKVLKKLDLVRDDGTLAEPATNVPLRVRVVEVRELVKSGRLLNWEEASHPPWISEVYKNDKIGKEFYAPLYGVGAIVDDKPGLGSRVAIPGSGKVKVKQTRSTKDSVDALVAAYSEIKKQGISPWPSVSNFVNRPIATMRDVLGDPTLRYDQRTGEPVKKTGKEGFHSRAVAPVKDFKGLLDDRFVSREAAPDDKGRDRSIPSKLDVRPERRAAVLAYRKSLRHRGQRG